MPNVNPDGCWRGHLRTNAAGVNLNRAWAAANADEAPEVYHLLRKMDEWGESAVCWGSAAALAMQLGIKEGQSSLRHTPCLLLAAQSMLRHDTANPNIGLTANAVVKLLTCNCPAVVSSGTLHG